jgi:hypothetical protein
LFFFETTAKSAIWILERSENATSEVRIMQMSSKSGNPEEIRHADIGIGMRRITREKANENLKLCLASCPWSRKPIETVNGANSLF